MASTVTVTLGTGQKVTVSRDMAESMARTAESRGYADVASRIRSEIAAQTGGAVSSSSGAGGSGALSGSSSSGSRSASSGSRTTYTQSDWQDYLKRNIQGYDPYWVQKLPAQAQQYLKSQGVDISKPMPYEQAASMGGLPPLSSLRPEVQQSIVGAEIQAGLRPDPRELEYQRKLESIQRMLGQVEQARADLERQNAELVRRIQEMQQEALRAMQPVKIQEPPKLQDITPAEDIKAAQPQEQPKDVLPRTAGGFVQPYAPLPYLPSVDRLFDLYEQVFGKKPDEQVRAYLTGPQFQGILQGGTVPMWMSSDPLWRLYLARLGVLRRLGQQQ